MVGFSFQLSLTLVATVKRSVSASGVILLRFGFGGVLFPPPAGSVGNRYFLNIEIKILLVIKFFSSLSLSLNFMTSFGSKQHERMRG
jgi:hypothetical protein